LRSHVGIGSEAHCLFGRARTAAATSSCVTCLKLERTQSVDAKLGAAVLEVDARISETFGSRAFSTLEIWPRVFQSRVFSVPHG